MAKMWSGRFEQESSQLLEEFNASVLFDNTLYNEDIEGSLAHSTMLAEVGILTLEEKESIHQGLKTIQHEIESGLFQWRIEDEDVHMAIEKRLTELIGDAGKKLHTARSRNDQVALDFRLWTQRRNRDFLTQLKELIEVCITLATQHTTTLLPGMTHLQHAQPISFAYHILAYASMFKRDFERFESSLERHNYSPLGCAALAGTPHPINRQRVSEILGFTSPTINCLDTVSDRDFALEILFNIATLMMHASRLSEEIIIWSSSEFRFVTLSDAYSTGSSIMPQKKNPDVPELIRGKTGRVNGNLISLLTVMKGLPLAYNKDMQEDKESVFDSVKTGLMCLKILTELLKTMTINIQVMQQATQIGHLTATDLADYLVKKGIPFRETHHISGSAVALAETKGCDISELSLEELQGIDNRIEADVLEKLTALSSMNARISQGATAECRVKEQIVFFNDWLKK